MTLRSLCLISISTMTICCHLPNNNLLSLKGMVRLGPTKDALTCECPFPSCQVLSCSYSRFFGSFSPLDLIWILSGTIVMSSHLPYSTMATICYHLHDHRDSCDDHDRRYDLDILLYAQMLGSSFQL